MGTSARIRHRASPSLSSLAVERQLLQGRQETNGSVRDGLLMPPLGAGRSQSPDVLAPPAGARYPWSSPNDCG